MAENPECNVCGKADTELLKCGRCKDRVYCGELCQKKDWPTHKAECIHQNYQLKIDLCPRFITNPRITRTLSCPADAKFAELHEALQIAFGWANTHLYDFDVFDHSDTMGHEHRLAGRSPIFKITALTDCDDDFVVPGLRMPKKRDSSKVTLRSVLDNTKTKGKTIHYVYDFGDNWEHVITCIGRGNATPHFVCLEGEGHGCAEDAGGAPGWIRLLEAYDAQVPTEKEKELMSWFERFASNKESSGLGGDLKWKWDKNMINTKLGNLNSSAEAAPLPTNSILFISFKKEGWFDEMYAQVLRKVRERAVVTEVTTNSSALQELSKPHGVYAAVVVTSAAIMEKKFLAVQLKLKEHVEAGGTVIFGFLFASFATPPKLKSFFQNIWYLNWHSGDYYRATFSLNPMATAAFRTRNSSSLQVRYSMKALHLQNIKAEDRMYIERPDSTQSPAVLAQYGNNNGYLGWIGDVNTEEGTTEVLLTMCGI